MPIETQEAVNFAIQYEYVDEFGILHKASEENYLLVDKVRAYFNTHEIEYSTFSYDDLVPYLPQEAQ